MKWLALTCSTLMSAAVADEWRTTQDGTLYAYSASTMLRADSVLNPGNQLAQLPSRSNNLEARLNLKAEDETWRLSARPILARRDSDQSAQHEAWLSQFQLKAKLSDTWNLSAGREVLNWGAAQFRSPASPFYFDNGRANPMRELSGMDVLKLSRTGDNSVHLVRIHGSGHGAMQSDLWRNAWLIKLDQHGEDWAGGLVAAKAPGHAGFYSAHGQYTLNDALLAYAELSSATQYNVLVSTPDATQPFSVLHESARKLTVLTGAAYTFESGQSLAAEYLHDSHGYTGAEARAYFKRAPAPIALGLAPRLLGRDYLHLVWQSNLMESDGYWRLMATHSGSDRGLEFSGYIDRTLSPSISAFSLASFPAGNPYQEFSSLFRYSVTAGLKVALP